MTTYDEILDSEINPGQPGKSDLFYRLRDNVLAIIEGDATAPKISNAALSTVPGQNIFIRDTAGTYSLVIPAGITSISAKVVGGGGGGAQGEGGDYAGGGGGELRFTRIAVTPGETLTLIVGAGGEGSATVSASNGTESKIHRSGSTLLSAAPGYGATRYSGTVSAGGGGVGGTGGVGVSGKGGSASSTTILAGSASGLFPGGIHPNATGNHSPGGGGPRRGQIVSAPGDLSGFDGIIIVEY